MSYQFNKAVFEKRKSKAQMMYDLEVIRCSTPFVPISEGVLRNSAYTNGKGTVKWITPYAHYQYTGKDMVGVESRLHWAKQYEPKEYNGKILQHKNSDAPEAASHWDKVAAEKYMKDWKKLVGDILSGNR